MLHVVVLSTLLKTFLLWPNMSDKCKLFCANKWLYCGICVQMCLTTPLSRVYWKQESVKVPGILSSTFFRNFKFCAVFIKQKPLNFSCLSFFPTEEVLQPKQKLLLEWKQHKLFRTYKSVLIKTHIKGR